MEEDASEVELHLETDVDICSIYLHRLVCGRSLTEEGYLQLATTTV